MAQSPAERRAAADRRAQDEQRDQSDRRSGERRKVSVPVPVERRSGTDRRQAAERRSGGERRSAQESAGEHIRNALVLITHVAESGRLDDEHRRDLDAALFRLRFALDRLEQDS